MKKILALVAFLATMHTAQAQITTSGGQVYFAAGELQSYTNPTIVVCPEYWLLQNQVRCRILITAPSSTAVVGEKFIILDKSTIDAKTGTGTGDTAKFFSAVNQAIKDYLSGLSENAGITFTIL